MQATTSTTGAAMARRRDAPEIAAAVERGEYRSIRQAALAAGIIREPSPLDLLRRDWKKASEEERAAFLEEIHH